MPLREILPGINLVYKDSLESRDPREEYGRFFAKNEGDDAGRSRDD